MEKTIDFDKIIKIFLLNLVYFDYQKALCIWNPHISKSTLFDNDVNTAKTRGKLRNEISVYNIFYVDNWMDVLQFVRTY